MDRVVAPDKPLATWGQNLGCTFAFAVGANATAFGVAMESAILSVSGSVFLLTACLMLTRVLSRYRTPLMAFNFGAVALIALLDYGIIGVSNFHDMPKHLFLGTIGYVNVAAFLVGGSVSCGTTMGLLKLFARKRHLQVLGCGKHGAQANSPQQCVIPLSNEELGT